MQIISQNRSFQRVLILVFITALITIASWALTSTRGMTASLQDVYGYLANSVSRTNAPTDELIRNLQEQLTANPNDWQSYSQLGLAYLQKARETGDPTYYQKTEEALDKALSFQPDDYASVSAKGALALARHDFALALEWGEKAKEIRF